ncbi:MAG: hypothetical protein GC131_02105 [Alphaproteobacteria bacterium]|nr:hypothetical protein [Alphaproteobacteria bacterium]
MQSLWRRARSYVTDPGIVFAAANIATFGHAAFWGLGTLSIAIPALAVATLLAGIAIKERAPGKNHYALMITGALMLATAGLFAMAILGNPLLPAAIMFKLKCATWAAAWFGGGNILQGLSASEKCKPFFANPYTAVFKGAAQETGGVRRVAIDFPMRLLSFPPLWSAIGLLGTALFSTGNIIMAMTSPAALAGITILATSILLQGFNSVFSRDSTKSIGYGRVGSAAGSLLLAADNLLRFNIPGVIQHFGAFWGNSIIAKNILVPKRPPLTQKGEAPKNKL